MDLRELVTAPKSLDLIPQWKLPVDARRFEFTQTLSIQGITIGGFMLRGKAHRDYVDRDVMFQMELFSSGRSSIRLWRVDWRPFHSHTNDSNCPRGLAFEVFEGTHDHEFSLNYLPYSGKMRSGNLPNACEIHPDPKNYFDILDYCANRFNIVNMRDILPPETSADLQRPSHHD